jgi:hypothetical protein
VHLAERAAVLVAAGAEHELQWLLIAGRLLDMDIVVWIQLHLIAGAGVVAAAVDRMLEPADCIAEVVPDTAVAVAEGEREQGNGMLMILTWARKRSGEGVVGLVCMMTLVLLRRSTG